MKFFKKHNRLYVRPLSIFVHLPKCGGTSVSQWLADEKKVRLHKFYSTRDVENGWSHIDNSHVSFGHMHLGMLQDKYNKLIINPNVYIYTLVRDPLRRFLSLYSYLAATNTIPVVGLKSFLDLVRTEARSNGLMSVFYLSQTLPQMYWLENIGLSNIQLIGKLEMMNFFVNTVQNRFGISSTPQKLNHSISLLNDNDRLTVMSRDFQGNFYDFYRRDYEFLAYDVDFNI